MSENNNLILTEAQIQILSEIKDRQQIYNDNQPYDYEQSPSSIGKAIFSFGLGLAGLAGLASMVVTGGATATAVIPLLGTISVSVAGFVSGTVAIGDMVDEKRGLDQMEIKHKTFSTSLDPRTILASYGYEYSATSSYDEYTEASKYIRKTTSNVINEFTNKASVLNELVAILNNNGDINSKHYQKALNEWRYLSLEEQSVVLMLTDQVYSKIDDDFYLDELNQISQYYKSESKVDEPKFHRDELWAETERRYKRQMATQAEQKNSTYTPKGFPTWFGGLGSIEEANRAAKKAEQHEKAKQARDAKWAETERRYKRQIAAEEVKAQTAAQHKTDKWAEIERRYKRQMAAQAEQENLSTRSVRTMRSIDQGDRRQTITVQVKSKTSKQRKVDAMEARIARDIAGM